MNEKKIVSFAITDNESIMKSAEEIKSFKHTATCGKTLVGFGRTEGGDRAIVVLTENDDATYHYAIKISSLYDIITAFNELRDKEENS